MIMIVCFTAHRPHLLYGYELRNKKYQLLAKKIREICIMLIERYSIDTFITGGALGGDTVSFFCSRKFEDPLSIYKEYNSDTF